jgi:SAM-dependent methyltransferase
MGLRAGLCFALSRRLLPSPATRTVDYAAYDKWRQDSLAGSWAAFSDRHVTGKDVLDFGCGDGQLTRHLSRKGPRRIVGVDLNAAAIGRARKSGGEFIVGGERMIPVPDESFDTIVAFDCMEHVMAPGQILREWRRVLRSGGHCLIEWYPFSGPWGPHMESLIPLPWAQFIFGPRAMFRAAERIYDLPEFVPRHWDLDDVGNKKPNKWRAWSSFKEQGYVNELSIGAFRAMAEAEGFLIARLDKRTFGGATWRRLLGKTLMRIPGLGDLFVSHVVVELRRR